MRTWSEEIDKALRAPFEGADIGLLPKVPKSIQDDPNKKADGCGFCGGYHKPIRDSAHVPYLSHQVVQARLDQVVGTDGWSYTVDHLATDPKGGLGGIMATLTIAGLTKGPEGGAPNRPGTWGEQLKLAISDWLPRAAMRFGVQLQPDAAKLAGAARKASGRRAQSGRELSDAMVPERVIPALLEEHGYSAEEAVELIRESKGEEAGDITVERLLAARKPAQFALVREVLEAHSRKAA